jgi:hypothetical protein
MKTQFRPVHVALVALLIGGCATPPPATVNHPAPPPSAAGPVVRPSAPAPAPMPAPPPAPAIDTEAGERALTAAIATYDRGDFAAAARLLTPMTNDGSLDPAQLLRALKVLAFSQCSTNAVTACRQTFERALKADANFDLLPAEKGHPIWGPQFVRARRTVLGR